MYFPLLVFNRYNVVTSDLNLPVKSKVSHQPVDSLHMLPMFVLILWYPLFFLFLYQYIICSWRQTSKINIDSYIEDPDSDSTSLLVCLVCQPRHAFSRLLIAIDPSITCLLARHTLIATDLRHALIATDPRHTHCGRSKVLIQDHWNQHVFSTKSVQ